MRLKKFFKGDKHFHSWQVGAQENGKCRHHGEEGIPYGYRKCLNAHTCIYFLIFIFMSPSVSVADESNIGSLVGNATGERNTDST